MKKIYEYMGFILGFMFLVLVFDMSFGNKATEKFILLTLFSMLIINADKFISFLQNNFTLQEV